MRLSLNEEEREWLLAVRSADEDEGGLVEDEIVRERLVGLVARGLVERVGEPTEGVYRITAAGVSALREAREG